MGARGGAASVEASAGSAGAIAGFSVVRGSSALAGSDSVKLEPLPSTLWKLRSPFIMRARCWLMTSPMPTPSADMRSRPRRLNG